MICPFPGLRAFRRDESRLFFGRDDQIDALLETLDQSHFVAVLGTSGCGKSSLVRAGLIAALEAGSLPHAGARWKVAEMRPGDDPRRRLVAALLDDAGRGSEHASETAEEFLLATVSRGPRGLLEALRETPLPARTNLLLLVDQFEEIFRYRQRGGADEAEAFVTLLLTTIREAEASAAAARGSGCGPGGESAVYVIITMRSEFLGHCAVFDGLPEAINRSQFLVPRLDEDQRREAIEGPARVVRGAVAPELVTRLLNDMSTHQTRTDTNTDILATPGADQLPLMQHVLMRTWQIATAATRSGTNNRLAGVNADNQPEWTLTLDHYEDAAVRGLANALSLHAQATYGELKEERQRWFAKVMFRRLSGGVPGQRDLRNPTALGTIADVAGVTESEMPALIEVVDAFRQPDRSFITTSPSNPQSLTRATMVDITHESLIRQWEQLDDWSRTEARSAGAYRSLETQARDWERAGRAPRALLRELPLENALDWKRRERPNAAWAERYGPDFELVQEFLEKSEAARAKERAAVHEREMKQARRRTLWYGGFASVCVLVVTMAVMLAAWYEREYRPSQSRSLGETSRLRIRDGLVDSGLLHGLAALERADTFEARSGLFSGLLSGVRARRSYALSAVPDQVRTMAISPDGRWVAAIGEGEAGQENTVFLWDLGAKELEPRQLTAPGGEGSSATTMTFSREGRFLASGGCREWKTGARRCTHGGIQLWDLTSFVGRSFPAHDGAVQSLAFSPDSKVLVSGGGDNLIVLWNWDGKTLSRRLSLDGHVNAVSSVAVDTAKGVVVSAACRAPKADASGPEGPERCTLSEVRVWKEQRSSEPVIMHHGNVLAMAFDASGTSLASAGEDNAIVIWRVAETRRTKSLSPLRSLTGGHAAPIVGLVYSPDGKKLASSARDKTVTIWNPQDPVSRGKRLVGHEGAVLAVAFTDEGNELVSVDAVGIVKWWDPRAEPADQGTPVGSLGPVSSVAFSADGTGRVSARCKSSLTQEKFPTCTESELRVEGLEQLSKDGEDRPVAPGLIHSLALSENRRYVASGGDDAHVLLLSLDKSPPRKIRLMGHSAPVYSLAFDPRVKWLASGSCGKPKGWKEGVGSCREGEIRLWDLREEPPKSYSSAAHEAPVTALAFSAGGKFLASGGGTTMMLWNVTDTGLKQREPGDLVRRDDRDVPRHDAPVTSLAFGRNDTVVASGSLDGSILLRSVENQWRPKKLSRHQAGILSLAFSEDGKLLASGSIDSTVVLWDVEQAQPIVPRALSGHDAPVLRVLFKAGDGSLLSGSTNGRILQWPLGLELVKKRACEMVVLDHEKEPRKLGRLNGLDPRRLRRFCHANSSEVDGLIW